jgi:dTDP-4-dehydrorhamnose 3,5-epimerase-like enzyme
LLRDAHAWAGVSVLTLELPHGVTFSPLRMNRDERGSLTEIFRDEWIIEGGKPCQWNLTKTNANVLRGVHVHYKHADYMVVVDGKLSIGLYDARPKSPTYRKSTLFEFSAESVSALSLPVGIMHGFYAHEPTLYVYGVDSYYDPQDELGCHWADPALSIPWPCQTPELSERDKSAAPLSGVEAKLLALNPDLA